MGMAKSHSSGRRAIVWIGVALTIAVAMTFGAYQYWPGGGNEGAADADDPTLVSIGQRVYAENCVSCHGQDLEGQPEWQIRLPSGRLPAPPHDETGHTWHHPDALLFGMTKEGVVAFTGLENYESDMPAYGEILTDEEIWAVIAFIKSTWPPEVRQRHADIDQRAREN